MKTWPIRPLGCNGSVIFYFTVMSSMKRKLPVSDPDSQLLTFTNDYWFG